MTTMATSHRVFVVIVIVWLNRTNHALLSVVLNSLEIKVIS